MNTNYDRTDRIKQFIKENNIIQPNIADKTGIKQSVISRQLNSENGAGATLCYAMILHYGINPRWLEYGEEPVTIDYNSLKNGVKNKVNNDSDIERKYIKSLEDIISLKNKVEELQKLLSESKHALKNTVTAD